MLRDNAHNLHRLDLLMFPVVTPATDAVINLHTTCSRIDVAGKIIKS